MSASRQAPDSLLMRFSERVFRILLQAYPKPFREEYGLPMALTFRDLLREAQTQGTGRVANLWFRTFADIVSTAFRERSEAMQGKGWSLLAAMALGLAIAWVDSRPNWDDTGITAGVLFLSCTLLGAISPKQAWQWALAVGLWIPLYGVLWRHDPKMVIAFVPPFLGVYLGVLIRLLAFPPPSQA